MSFLARKISRAKWQGGDDLDENEIPADAITADLKTTGNALSFWASPTDDECDLKQVVLALATGLERIDKLDIAWLDSTTVAEAGLTVAKTPGLTKVAKLVDTHRDIERLDLVRLGRVTSLLDMAINCKQHNRYNKRTVVRLIADAIEDGSLELEELAEKVRAEVEKLLKY